MKTNKIEEHQKITREFERVQYQMSKRPDQKLYEKMLDLQDKRKMLEHEIRRDIAQR